MLNGRDETLAYDSSLHISPEHALAIARSASCYGCAKYILVEPVVVPELKFRHIEGQIFLADLMKRPDHTTLEDRPKAFDGIGMHGTDDILPFGVIDHFVRVFLMKLAVPHPLVRDQQAHVIRYGFIDELGQGFSFDVPNDTSHHIALALDRTRYDRLASAASSAEISSSTFTSVLVLGFPADKGFIDLDDPAELRGIARAQGDSNAMAHIPGGLVRTEAHVAADLQGAHALLTRQHQVRHLEPIQQRLVRVLEDCSTDVREAIGRHGRALIALPMPGIVLQLGRIVRTTTGALHTLRPAFADEIGRTGRLIRKGLLELWDRHLMQKFCSGHGVVSRVDRSIAWPH